MSQNDLLEKLLSWGKFHSHFALYPGNQYPDPYHKYDLIFAAGARHVIQPHKDFFQTLKNTWVQKPTWLFGYVGYDVKNEVEHLVSSNFDGVEAPNLFFFEPEIIGYLVDDELTLICENPLKIFQEIVNTPIPDFEKLPALSFDTFMPKEEYLRRVRQLQHHIQQGDIYEVNFCTEFFARHADINPAAVFAEMNKRAHPPFAAFLHWPGFSVMCASPERYLQKTDNRLVSQPIKGTGRRKKNPAEDAATARELRHSEKERAENVMIVDLVRNDLSRVAQKASVHVPELFGIHTFPTVHQLISTVEAQLAIDKDWVDALKATFPMGSMTGAPKVRAMQLIEEFEIHKRGIYSGALGYITPTGDFDFNVVIRSLVYNQNTGYLSLSVGSAITILADAEQEYKECLLKAEALLGLFQNKGNL